MRVIVGAGHRAGGLLNLWRPLSWMQAIAMLQERLDQETDRHGAIEVVSTMEPGLGLMLGAAALMARDTGRPVRLVAAIAYASQFDAWASAGEASRWYFKALERVDERIVLLEGRPQDKRHADLLVKERSLWMLGRAAAADNALVLARIPQGSGRPFFVETT